MASWHADMVVQTASSPTGVDRPIAVVAAVGALVVMRGLGEPSQLKLHVSGAANEDR